MSTIMSAPIRDDFTHQGTLEAIQPRPRATSRGFILSRRQRSLDDENRRLKEMLQQSLKREAEGLNKIKHLQDMYQELLYRTHGTSSHLKEDTKQYQLNCGGSPDEHTDDNSSTTTVQVTYPQLLVQDKEITQETKDKDTDIIKINGSLSTPPKEVVTLAPLPLGLRDVRHEREKPPSSCKETVPIVQKQIQATDSPHINKLVRQRSRSDEYINNKIDKSSSIVEVRSRANSFWKRKSRNISELGNLSENYDILFKQFTQSASIHVDPLSKYLGLHWSAFCADRQCSREDEKYRNAVWELFQEETKYLTRQLQPLEKVYKGFLEELHFHGQLEEAKIDRIFSNISELCELSSSIANDLLKLFERRSSNSIALPNELILSFSMFGHKFNPVYKYFCTNYEHQRGYIKHLERLPHFQEYLRVCRTAPIVQRSDLSDLLIAPMQHQCHYQLLLDNVLKYTHDPSHRAVLHSTIKAFVVSLKELESAIAQHKCSLELLELEELIYWPPVTQLSPDNFIPQSLTEHIQQQPCATLLTSSNHYLKLQGSFKMLDSRGRPYYDVQLILLNDLLLLSEIKGQSNKKGQYYSLMYQPFPPNNISIHRPPVSPRPVLTMICQSSLGQQLVCFSLLSSNEEERESWVTELLALGAKLI